jgi:arylamine N-acetyltransferase
MDHDMVVAYLDRVGVSAPRASDAAGLRALHRAHQVTVPFENLSIHLAEPISQQTSPRSHFTRSTICSRLTPGGRVSISGRMLIQTTRGGTRTEQQLDTDDAVLAAYREHFGIELSRVPDDPAA